MELQKGVSPVQLAFDSSTIPSQSSSRLLHVSVVGEPGMTLHAVMPMPVHTVMPLRWQAPTPTVQGVPKPVHMGTCTVRKQVAVSPSVLR
jgi:hypothetical protein